MIKENGSIDLAKHKFNNAKKKLGNHRKKPFNNKKTKFKERLITNFNKSVSIEKKKDTRANITATKPEEKVKEILKVHGIKFEQEYEILGKFYDFYLPKQSEEENDILIEVDGVYWHGKDQEDLTMRQTKQRIEDFYKASIAMIKQIPLIRIWEDEIFEEELLKEILHCRSVII